MEKTDSEINMFLFFSIFLLVEWCVSLVIVTVIFQYIAALHINATFHFRIIFLCTVKSK